jgi:hypothetical protein
MTARLRRLNHQRAMQRERRALNQRASTLARMPFADVQRLYLRDAAWPQRYGMDAVQPQDG